MDPASAPLSPARRRILVVFLLLPFVIAGWLRLAGNGAMPPFCDEGANILTSLDPGVRQTFDPLGQGRPLLAWMFRPVALFPSAPVAVARGMTALAGLVAMAALAWTAHVLAGWTAAVVALWLTAVLPFAVWHERLALQDPFMAALLAIVLAVAVSGNRAAAAGLRGWFHFGIAGLLIGIAFLVKISVVVALPAFAVVWCVHRLQLRLPVWDRRLAALTLALVPPAFLGRDLAHLGTVLKRYNVLPSLEPTEVAAGFWDATVNRLVAWLGWYHGYGGWALWLLLAVALAAAMLRRDRTALLCGAAWLLTLAINVLVYHLPYARYSRPDYLLLALFFGTALGPVLRDFRMGGGRRLTGWFVSGMVTLGFGAWLNASCAIVADPARAPVPADEIQQYVTGPWSAESIGRVQDFLEREAARHAGGCLVLTHRYECPGAYTLMFAALGNPRIGVVPVTIYLPEELTVALNNLRRARVNTDTAVFVLYEGLYYPVARWVENSPRLQEVLTVPRSGDVGAWRLFRCTPEALGLQ